MLHVVILVRFGEADAGEALVHERRMIAAAPEPVEPKDHFQIQIGDELFADCLEIKGQVTTVGDDLLATNPERVKKAVAEGACDGILVKPNQIGTVSETLDVVKMARDANWKVIVSHRSGETNDWFIADFAVGVGSDYTKFGAPARGERIVKYNRLLTIEAELRQNPS